MVTTKKLKSSMAANRRQINEEIIDWKLYSSVVLGAAATAATFNFFQDSISSVGKAKTNMETPAQLNSNKTFLVTEISCLVFNRDGAPFRSDNAIAYGPNIIFATMSGEFKVNSIIRTELHGLMFHEPFERVDAATTVGAGAVNTRQYKTWKLKSPIQLDPQTNFIITCSLTTPAAATGGYSITVSEMMFVLGGYMSRKK